MQVFRVYISTAISVLLSLAVSRACGAELYAFGPSSGDQSLLRGDESAEEIRLASFPYYGVMQDDIYVSHYIGGWDIHSRINLVYFNRVALLICFHSACTIYIVRSTSIQYYDCNLYLYWLFDILCVEN